MNQLIDSLQQKPTTAGYISDPERLSRALKFLQERSSRIIRLNPMLGPARQTTAAKSIWVARPWIARHLPAHSLESLEYALRQL